MRIVKLRVTGTTNAKVDKTHEEVYRWDPGKPLTSLTYANVIRALRTLTNRASASFILRYDGKSKLPTLGLWNLFAAPVTTFMCVHISVPRAIRVVHLSN